MSVTLSSLIDCKSEPVALATLAVYGEAADKLADAHPLALEALATLPNEVFESQECPLCAGGVPLTIEKPRHD